jgi:mRNA-degrading endonuclease HigB of HigAB toxin-antitoxin module
MLIEKKGKKDNTKIYAVVFVPLTRKKELTSIGAWRSRKSMKFKFSLRLCAFAVEKFIVFDLSGSSLVELHQYESQMNVNQASVSIAFFLQRSLHLQLAHDTNTLYFSMLPLCLYGYFYSLAGFWCGRVPSCNFSKYLTSRTEFLLPFLMTATAITMSLVTDVSQMSLYPF